MLPPKPAFPACFSPFPAPRRTSQNAAYTGWAAGAPTYWGSSGGLSVATPLDAADSKNWDKVFLKKNRSLRKLFCISFLNGLHGTKG